MGSGFRVEGLRTYLHLPNVTLLQLSCMSGEFGLPRRHGEGRVLAALGYGFRAYLEFPNLSACWYWQCSSGVECYSLNPKP